MKREILFRGKTEKGKWVYGAYLKMKGKVNLRTRIGVLGDPDEFKEFDYDKHLIHVFELPKESGWSYGDSSVSKFIEVLPETVGQYWKNDDKGNKIFTGDTNSYSYYCDNEKIECVDVVCFDLEGGYHYWKEFNGERPSFIPYEVNGNIHDNPELI